jgi:hypothetical protein
MHSGAAERIIAGHFNTLGKLKLREHLKLLIHLQVKRASLVDSRTEVNDVKFAPHYLGLMIVCFLSVCLRKVGTRQQFYLLL